MVCSGELPAGSRADRETCSDKCRKHRQRKGDEPVSVFEPKNELYTPALIVDACRAAMGGIDVDPCSDLEGMTREIIGAGRVYTIDDSGVAPSAHWDAADGSPGRIFANPPYLPSQLLRSFLVKLIKEMDAGRVRAACVLMPLSTLVSIAGRELVHRSRAIVLVGSVSFYGPGAGPRSPGRGWTLVALGDLEVAELRELGDVLQYSR